MTMELIIINGNGCKNFTYCSDCNNCTNYKDYTGYSDYTYIICYIDCAQGPARTNVHFNENNDNGVVQNQYSVIGGRMLYGHDISFQNDITGSMTSLASNDSIFSSSSTSTVDKNNEGRNHHDGSGTLSSHPSITGETIRVDISDDSSVSCYNSHSEIGRAKTTPVTRGSRGSTMTNESNRQRSKSYDNSFEDLKSLGEKKEEWTRAKEKAQRKELLDESTYGRRKAEKGFKGHLNKYDMENRDRENSCEVSSEETLRKRIRELNSLGQGSDKDVIEGSNRSEKSGRTAKREGESSDYSLKNKIAQRDNVNLGLNQNERLLRRVQEMNANDREHMERTLNRIKENGKNKNLKDLEYEIESQLGRVRKYIKLNYDERNSIASSTDDSAFGDEHSSSIYIGNRGVEKCRSKGRITNDVTELRSYIDETMDEKNAEITHMLVNIIEKYKNEVSTLKEKNRNQVRFMNLRHNLKLREILLYVPLITLITSATLCFLMTQYWMIPFVSAYFISMYSFALGTLVSYGIMGRIMFNSPSTVIDFILGKKSKANADYLSPRRKKSMFRF
ncbi:Uncharacterized protein PCOAH_00051190 [Plasmodium coatneyi]|uniref:Uncharacterized protein n=1 Tax=Plasmodium coatneyi TaxID=208452 RepID=A0A1B1E689_9APIC|nr:Uncharacterized protein PCOAH_00051190 [Plasmodium coatneyi]ANQ10515.1 Uncharacterized protein PCOAH_00051190 [Plasmodium coatneyi]